MVNGNHTDDGENALFVPDCEGRTPLELAVIHGHTEAVGVLLHILGDLQSDGIRGTHPRKAILGELLHLVLRYNHHEIVVLLIFRDANINHRSMRGETPTYIAAQYENKNCLGLLIAAKSGDGLDVNGAEEVYGWTPLVVACVNGNRDIIDMLLGAGAKQDIQDKCGWTAREHAAFKGHLEIAELLDARKIDSCLGIAATAPSKREESSDQRLSLMDNGCIIFHLGGMHRGKGVKIVDFVYVGNTANSTAGLRFEITVRYVPTCHRLVDLPILNDMSVEPFVAPIPASGKAEVVFKILQTSRDDEPRGRVLCCGATFLGVDEFMYPGVQRENLVRECTVNLLDLELGGIVGTVTLTYVVARPFVCPIAPVVKPRFQNATGVQFVGHRGTYFSLLLQSIL